MVNYLEFEIYLRRRNIAKRTIRQQINWLKKIEAEAESFDKQNLDKYFLELLDKGHTPGYLNVGIKSIRNLVKTQNIYPDLKDFPFFREQEIDKAILSVEELEAFLNLPPPPNEYYKKRYDCLTDFFKVLACTGARPIEIARLTLQDADLGKGVFNLPTSKTRNPRRIPIHPYIKPIVQQAVERCKDYDSILFPNYLGRIIHDSKWSTEFQARIKRLGIKRRRLTCYSLRYSFITHMLEEDTSFGKVQKIVGHKRLETTAKYTKYTTKDIRKAILKHPLVKRAQTPQQKRDAWLEVTQEILGEDYLIDQSKLVEALKLKEDKKIEEKK